MLLGGEPLGERFIWWNFVSSRKERIEQAKEDWKQAELFCPQMTTRNLSRCLRSILNRREAHHGQSRFHNCLLRQTKSGKTVVRPSRRFCGVGRD